MAGGQGAKHGGEVTGFTPADLVAILLEVVEVLGAVVGVLGVAVAEGGSVGAIADPPDRDRSRRQQH